MMPQPDICCSSTYWFLENLPRERDQIYFLDHRQTADCREELKLWVVVQFVDNSSLARWRPTLPYLDILLEQTIRLPRMSTKEQKERTELLQGTLDLLVLKTLVLGPAHGHAVAKAIEFNSDDVLQVEQGSLYPALHRLIKRGWISVEGGISENNRRAKFYRLTAKGRRQLAVETSKWERLAGAIARILRPEAQEGKS